MDTAARQDTTDELAQNSKQTKRQNLKKRSSLPRSPRRSESNAVALVARKTTTLPRIALTSLFPRGPKLDPEGWSVAAGLGGCVTASVTSVLGQSFCDNLMMNIKKQHKENEE